MRKKFTGVLNVYRESMLRETLSAAVDLPDGKTLNYYRAPKAFEDLINTKPGNCIKVEFVADEDGKNPRSVKALGEPY